MSSRWRRSEIASARPASAWLVSTPSATAPRSMSGRRAPGMTKTGTSSSRMKVSFALGLAAVTPGPTTTRSGCAARMRATVTSSGATAARTPRRASRRSGPPVTTSTSRGGASTVMMRLEPSRTLAG